MDGGVDEAPRANVNMEDGQGPYTVNMSRWHYYAVHNIQCTIYTIYTFHNKTFYIKYNTQRKAAIIACQRGGYEKYIRNTKHTRLYPTNRPDGKTQYAERNAEWRDRINSSIWPGFSHTWLGYKMCLRHSASYEVCLFSISSAH